MLHFFSSIVTAFYGFFKFIASSVIIKTQKQHKCNNKTTNKILSPADSFVVHKLTGVCETGDDSVHTKES